MPSPHPCLCLARPRLCPCAPGPAPLWGGMVAGVDTGSSRAGSGKPRCPVGRLGSDCSDTCLGLVQPPGQTSQPRSCLRRQRGRTEQGSSSTEPQVGVPRASQGPEVTLIGGSRLDQLGALLGLGPEGGRRTSPQPRGFQAVGWEGPAAPPGRAGRGAGPAVGPLRAEGWPGPALPAPSGVAAMG